MNNYYALNFNLKTPSQGVLIASTLMATALTSHGALVSSTGPSFLSSTTEVTNQFLDIDSDGTDDFLAVFVGQGSLAIQALGASGIVGGEAEGTFFPTAFSTAGSVAVGPSSVFGGGETDMPDFATFAEESAATGTWLGGNDAFFAFEFDISGDTHYGYARLEYVPETAADSNLSSANFVELVYEDVAGAAIPEPSSLGLLAVTILPFLRRRR